MSGSEQEQGVQPGLPRACRALLGTEQHYAQSAKADWLMADPEFYRLALKPRASMLDFGCGDGMLLRRLRRRGAEMDLCGCDPSGALLKDIQREWVENKPPRLTLIDAERLPFEAASFDIVLVSGVLHHIAVADRQAVLLELGRVLKPGGLLFAFEHNPWHPLVGLMALVSAKNRGAALLSGPALCRGLEQAGFIDCDLRYLLYLPAPVFRLVRPASVLRRLPFGGQEVVRARRPD